MLKLSSAVDLQGHTAMQVRNDEPGRSGCWFPGQIAEASGQHALVIYNDLLDKQSGAPLREWYPLPRCSQELAIATPHTIHIDGQRYQIRPAPPEEVGLSLC